MSTFWVCSTSGNNSPLSEPLRTEAELLNEGFENGT